MTGWRVSADTGGTFTDCLAQGPDGTWLRSKVLSSGHLRARVQETLPGGWLVLSADLPTEADWLCGSKISIKGQPRGAISAYQKGAIQLERSGLIKAGDLLEIDTGLEAPVLALRLMLPDFADSSRLRIGTTKGTNALLERKGARVALFLTTGFEDLLLIRDQKRPELFVREILREAPLYHRVFGVEGRIDTDGQEIQPIDCDALAEAAREALSAGCEVAAVCLLNSWRNPVHENVAGAVLGRAGFTRICLSSRIRPLIKYLDRAETTLVNATLSPVLDNYLDRIESELGDRSVSIMTSAGGLVSRQRFHAVDSLVSGPAGGLLGAVDAGRRVGWDRVLALDMGGTSTDVSRWHQRLELRQHIQVGQARLLAPALPIETVAAGGGSICAIREGRLHVGPESAGASPGPAAYGADGPLTLTDIHLLLGRIDPDGFPIPISLQASRDRMEQMLTEGEGGEWRALAEGFLDIATERMALAVRKVTLRDGEDPSRYGLVAFGGAGGLHACRLAAMLDIPGVLFPPDAGILSARGIHFAPRETIREEQFFGSVSDLEAIKEAFMRLGEAASADLTADGVAADLRRPPVCTVYIRIRGQEHGIPVGWEPGSCLVSGFNEQFVAIFGYLPRDPVLEVVKLRLRLVERVEEPEAETFPDGGDPAPVASRIEGWVQGAAIDLPVYRREEIRPGQVMVGPAIVRDPFGTFFIEPDWLGVCGTSGSILMTPAGNRDCASSQRLEEVERTLVMNRLEGLVEEMGDQLQRTALSTNIRERLDFSCALLDAEGCLLVNAPHIPVHLGAMGLCVRECIRRLQPGPGDVIVTNHPAFGGSHLPDVTVFGPIHGRDGRLMGYVANRAHHAEWGGRTPGSMPADARSLAEEGVVLHPRWLLRNGQDCFHEVEAHLLGARWPTRALRENRMDMEAQLASLQLGRQRFVQLLEDYGEDAVGGYFNTFHQTAASLLGDALRVRGPFIASSRQSLDDGHVIAVRLASDGERMCIDFSDTSGRHPGNLNATPAIVRSAILYVLRLLVPEQVPLNEGLLEKVDVRLPECFLNPDFPGPAEDCPAVVGGNVETSQRIVDALLDALGIMACSQGTMNNLLFGNETFGYYETIGGGAGAGPGFAGASGVHVHMTNTAITDPEVLEQRFPVHCRLFALRRGSGGSGVFPGGDGLVRELRFLTPVSASLLSQRRTRGPSGAMNGGAGNPGRQYIVRADGRFEAVKGIVQLELSSGEGIRIETPGGGGWGKA